MAILVADKDNYLISLKIAGINGCQPQESASALYVGEEKKHLKGRGLPENKLFFLKLSRFQRLHNEGLLVFVHWQQKTIL
jgi:hypothetical protein